MKHARSALGLFVLLVLSLSLGFAADDLLETTYDGSETQPYIAIPLFSLVSVPQAVRKIAKSRAGFLLLRSDKARLAVTRTAEQIADARAALVLLCTFLC